MKPTVFITSGTGKVGLATSKAINSRFSLYIDACVGIRNPLKAERLRSLEQVKQVIFDTKHLATISENLRGVERLFLIPPNAENRVEICKYIIDQAKLNGVNFVLLLSMLVANDHKLAFGNQFAEIEDHLKESGLRFCILRSNLYMENILAFRDHMRKKHEFVTTLPEDAKISYISVGDVGLGAATVLANPIGHEGKTYLLTGPATVSQKEMSEMLSDVIQYQLDYRKISYKERHNFLTKQALWPAWQVNGWEEVLRLGEKSNGTLQQVSTDFETITGVRSLTFAQWVMEHAHIFRDEPAPLQELAPKSAFEQTESYFGESAFDPFGTAAQAAVGTLPQPPPAGMRAAMGAYGERTLGTSHAPSDVGSRLPSVVHMVPDTGVHMDTFKLQESRSQTFEGAALPLTAREAAHSPMEALQAVAGEAPPHSVFPKEESALAPKMAPQSVISGEKRENTAFGS